MINARMAAVKRKNVELSKKCCVVSAVMVAVICAVVVDLPAHPIGVTAFSSIPPRRRDNICIPPTPATYMESIEVGRRDFFTKFFIHGLTATLITTSSSVALAKQADCYEDCFNNCKAIAPKNIDYCQSSCRDYCSQTDREDGLSGSVSSEKGEVGILGGSFGTGTVPKGEDKPPALLQIPGLDFTSNQGKKLIGY